MREIDIELALVHSVRKADGLCLKFTCPSMNGVPDRLVLLPGGKCAFVELKAPGKKTEAITDKKNETNKCSWNFLFCD